MPKRHISLPHRYDEYVVTIPKRNNRPNKCFEKDKCKPAKHGNEKHKFVQPSKGIDTIEENSDCENKHVHVEHKDGVYRQTNNVQDCNTISDSIGKVEEESHKSKDVTNIYVGISEDSEQEEDFYKSREAAHTNKVWNDKEKDQSEEDEKDYSRQSYASGMDEENEEIANDKSEKNDVDWYLKVEETGNLNKFEKKDLPPSDNNTSSSRNGEKDIIDIEEGSESDSLCFARRNEYMELMEMKGEEGDSDQEIKKHIYRRNEKHSEDSTESDEENDGESSNDNEKDRSGMSEKESINRHKCKNMDVDDEDTDFNVETERDVNKKNDSKIYTKSEFEFSIPYKEWIRLSFHDTPTYRRLSGNWTDVFAKYFNMVQPVCVLIFKYNRIARSRKAASFGLFSANCKHQQCKAIYKMTIAEEPENMKDVVVHVSRTGDLSFKNEARSRFAKGTRRQDIKKELERKGPYVYRSELLVDADMTQLRAGNFSSIPPKDVLKQVKAEERQYEKLSDCVIREVYAVKRTFDLLDSSSRSLKGYVQYIGFEPFYIINFCAEQIDLLAEACRKKDAFLYFDATGLSMKRPLDQPKRLYLYCLVLMTTRHDGGLRIAEMITNDHTTPSITNFLMRVRHALTTCRQYRAPRKLEIDFSFAMIHAVCRAFNSCDLATYLKVCWNSLSKDKNVEDRVTVLHICAAHMLKIFQKMITQSTEDKQKRKFWMYILARLQTTISLESAKGLVQDITSVCKSKLLSQKASRAMDRLKSSVQLLEEEIDVKESKDFDISHENFDGNLRTQSPFYEYFNTAIVNAYISELGECNELYCPTLIDKLLKNYLPFFPLWSGVLLCQAGRNIQGQSSRDSNAVVERQFATIKYDVFQKERNINPGKACRLLYVAAKGLAKCAIASSEITKYRDDIQEKEKWKKGDLKDHLRRKKKSKYFSTPSNKDLKRMRFVQKKETSSEESPEEHIFQVQRKRKKVQIPRKSSSKSSQNKFKKDRKDSQRSTDQDAKEQQKGHYHKKDDGYEKGKKSKSSFTPTSKDFNNKVKPMSEDKPISEDFSGEYHFQASFEFTDKYAMPWGGFDKKHRGISISNTCSIDNILTAIYIVVCSRPDVKHALSDCEDTAIQLILEICLNEMAKQKWIDAKIKFVRDLLRIQGSRVDLYGTEFEFAVKYLVRPQRHTYTTVCQKCLLSKSTTHDLIELDDVSKHCTIQELLSEWESGIGSRCPGRCGGSTSTSRKFDSLPVLLIVTVDFPSASGKLITDSLVEPITVQDTKFDLYAATTNVNNHHFRLIIRSKVVGPWYSYDGLRSKNRYQRLRSFQSQATETFVNLIYVKSRS